MLKDLQANILKGHGRNHTMNLFLKFNVQKNQIALQELTRLSGNGQKAGLRHLADISAR
jgi:hypothetical protein